MKQKPIQLWYDKKEPTIQIEILKSIALNGYQSTTTLIKTLGEREILDNKTGKITLKTLGVTTINTVIGKMSDTTHDLIQLYNYQEITKGKAKHRMYSLTEKGIKILLENQYEETNKPYLDVKELIIFLKRFNEDYVNQKPTKEIDYWESPKLNTKNVLDLYVDSNQQYKIELGKELSKYHSKIGELVNKIKEAKQKLKMLENELPSMLHESIEKQNKK